jgi:hypothetical protein
MMVNNKLELYILIPQKICNSEKDVITANIIPAKSEKEARETASTYCGKEGKAVWLDSSTKCILLKNTSCDIQIQLAGNKTILQFHK